MAEQNNHNEKLPTIKKMLPAYYLLGALVLVFLFAGASLYLYTQLKNQKNALANTQSELASVQSEKNDLDSKVSELSSKVDDLNNQIDSILASAADSGCNSSCNQIYTSAEKYCKNKFNISGILSALSSEYYKCVTDRLKP